MAPSRRAIIPSETRPMARAKLQRVDITVLKPCRGQVHTPVLREAARRALAVAWTHGPCRLGLVIADDDTTRHLNREFRGLDETTDVLAFSTEHPGQWEGTGDRPPEVGPSEAFIEPTQQVDHIGEVIISLPQAARQAQPGPTGLERELATLVVHGVLHLIGLDHADPVQEAEMSLRTKEALAGLPE